MGERPVLFSGPMVRAILDGRKTMTRRIMNPQPEIVPVPGAGAEAVIGKQRIGMFDSESMNEGWPALFARLVRCPYGAPGDRLWVKETMVRRRSPGEHGPHAYYAADDARVPGLGWGWKRDVLPSIYCPREFSRITLDVTGVRVEQLQDISDEDARAEGVELGKMQPAIINGERGEVMIFNPRKAYAVLWDQINAKRAPWASNPWVWCISFKRAALDLGDGEEG